MIMFQQASNHQNRHNNESEKTGGTLEEALTLVNCLKSCTETAIVPETQDNDKMNSFLVNSPSQQRTRSGGKMNINII